MLRHLRNLIVCFMVLWLPLQGAAAASMPFCQKTSHAQTMDAQPAHGDHHDAHHGHGDHGQPAKQLPCDSCVFCHLCVSAAFDTLAPFHPGGSERFILPPNDPVTSFIPEQPQRPPLASLA